MRLAVDGCSCDSVDDMHGQGHRVWVQVLCEEALRGPRGHKDCAGVQVLYFQALVAQDLHVGAQG